MSPRRVPRRLVRRACAVQTRLGATGRDLQGTAVELALAAPFLSLRDLAGWRARVATWQRVAVQDAALLARLDGIVARYRPPGAASPRSNPHERRGPHRDPRPGAPGPAPHAEPPALLAGVRSPAPLVEAARAAPAPVRSRRRDARPGPSVAVGDRIRGIRNWLGRGQSAFAQTPGVGRMTIARAERGVFVPRPSTLQRIAELGGVTVDWLLRGDQP